MNKEKITIVYSKTIDYDFLRQRPHHMLSLLSERGYNVAWLNTEFSNKRNLYTRRTKVNENLYVYHDWDVFKKKFQNPDIYFSSWAERYLDLEYIKPKLGVIYDSLDNFEENSHNELSMLAKSDVVLTTSESLYRLRKKDHNNVHMCPNGCFPEYGHKEYSFPEDLKPFRSKPIVLFSGALARWCDIDLLEFIASKYQIVMVGKLFGVKNIPANVYYLGEKKYDELQNYYHHCDITILPFNNRQEALYSDPIKTYESLAHGKLCVSSNIEESRKFDNNTVLVSKTRQHFMQNIEKALEMSKSEEIEKKCFEEAEKNSWHKRVDILESHILNLYNKQKEMMS